MNKNNESQDKPLIFYNQEHQSTKLEAENDYIPEMEREITEQKFGNKYLYYETVKKDVGTDGKVETSTRKLPGDYDMPLSENPNFIEKGSVYVRKQPNSNVIDLHTYKAEKEAA